ncbi:hypothetical protein [Gryllotalpicola kribbensis]
MATQLIPLDTAHSAIADNRFRTTARPDPFYSGLADQLDGLVTRRPEGSREQLGAGMQELLRTLGMRRTRDQRLDLAAGLLGWQLGTADQFAALLGNAELLGRHQHSVRDIIQAGVAAEVPFWRLPGNRTRVLALAGGRRFDRLVAPALTFPEWLSTTAGRSSVPPRSARHLLALELALRLAEFTDIGTVLGPSLSDPAAIAGPIPGFKPQPADLTVVRPDGLRVLVSLITSPGRSTEDRVRRFIELVHHSRLRDSGVVVFFMVAPSSSDEASDQTDTRTQVRHLIRKLTRDWAGTNVDRTADRVFLSDWRTLFPASHAASPEFFSLTVETPGADHQTALLDSSDLVFDSEPRHLEVFDNAQQLRAIPHWLRAYQKPVWPQAITALGLPGIPRLHTARETLGGARGGAQATTVPWRLA